MFLRILASILLFALTSYHSFSQNYLVSDFSNVNDWETQVIGGGAQDGWEITTSPNFLFPMTSPTAANGFAAYFPPANSTESTIYTANTINIGTNNLITVEFYHSHMKGFEDAISVVLLDPSLNIIDEVPLLTNAETYYHEHGFKRILLNAGSLSEVRVGFRYVEPANISVFEWKIDDVTIFNALPDEVNMEIPKIFSELGNGMQMYYSQVPTNHNYVFEFSSFLRNTGLNANNAFVEAELLEVSTSSVIESNQSTSSILNAQDLSNEKSIVFQSPTDLGLYEINASVNSTSPGFNNQSINSTFSRTFEVTNGVLAKDEGISSDPDEKIDLSSAIQNDPTAHITSSFIVDGNDLLYNVLLGISPNSNGAGFMEVEVLKNGSLMETFTNVEVTPQDFGEFISLTLNQSIVVEPQDEIVINVHLRDDNGNYYPDLNIAAGGTTKNILTDMIMLTNNIMLLTHLPVIRLNFNPCDGPGLSIPTLDITEEYCPNSCDAEVEITNFDSFFDYTWYDGDTNVIGNGNLLNNLCSDDYMIVIEGCGDTDTVFFTIEGNQQMSFVDFWTINASDCQSNDGTINFIFETNANYSFSTLEVEYNGPESGAFNVTTEGVVHSITDLPVGNYTVTLTDTDNSCAPLSYNVEIAFDTLEIPICLVTVDSTSSYNIVVWEKPSDISSIDSFFVYREVTTNTYEHIGSVHVDSLSQFEDLDANPNSTGYRYKLSVLDVCGNETDLSPYHNTIHLQYQGNGNFNWNHYLIEDQTSVISAYKFFRDDYDIGNWQVLITIPGNQNTYSDIDYALFPDANYRVEVEWFGGPCEATRAQDYNSTRSNRRKNSFGGGGDDTASVVNHYLNDFTVYPNPANDRIFIETDSEIEGYKVISALGKVVLNNSLNSQKEINISDLSKGVYTIEVITVNGVARRKFIKK